jgi:anti-sigma B factor antagonist
VGEVDLDTADHIRERLDQLRSAGFTRLILDLRGVTFLDSTGVALVLETDASARVDGFDFAVIEGPPRVGRAFEITGLRAALPFIDPSEVDRARRP